MKKIIVAIMLALSIMLTGASPSPDGIDYSTKAQNSDVSKRGVQVASQINGEGNRESLRRGQVSSFHDVDSVYVGYVSYPCYTYIDGVFQSTKGWKNVAWHRGGSDGIITVTVDGKYCY